MNPDSAGGTINPAGLHTSHQKHNFTSRADVSALTHEVRERRGYTHDF